MVATNETSVRCPASDQCPQRELVSKRSCTTAVVAKIALRIRIESPPTWRAAGAKPPLARIGSQRHRRAECAPEEVAVGQLDPLRRRGRSRGVDHRGHRVEVVRGAAGAPGGRAARSGSSTTSAAPSTIAARSRRRGADRPAPPPPPSRQACSATRSRCPPERDRDALAPARPARSQLARAGSRAAEQLAIGAGDSASATRDRVGAAPPRALEPGIDDHRPQASRWPTAPPRRACPITWIAAGEYTDIRYEKSADGGIAKITIDRPEVRNAFRPLT